MNGRSEVDSVGTFDRPLLAEAVWKRLIDGGANGIHCRVAA
jgi:hypothetical protein